jgi:hypothetical protein
MKQTENKLQENYCKLYWDISDAPSRAVKALFMITGIKHEGWSTDRLTRKMNKAAGVVEKGIPYVIVEGREILHYLLLKEKEVVQLNQLIDYVRYKFPELQKYYPDEKYTQIEELLIFNQNVLRPSMQLILEPYYEKNVHPI